MSTMTVGTKRPKKNIAYDGKHYGRVSALCGDLPKADMPPLIGFVPAFLS